MLALSFLPLMLLFHTELWTKKNWLSIASAGRGGVMGNWIWIDVWPCERVWWHVWSPDLQEFTDEISDICEGADKQLAWSPGSWKHAGNTYLFTDHFPISLSVSPYSWLILQILIMLLSSFTKSLPRHLEVIESKLKEISTQWAKSLAAWVSTGCCRKNSTVSLFHQRKWYSVAHVWHVFLLMVHGRPAAGSDDVRLRHLEVPRLSLRALRWQSGRNPGSVGGDHDEFEHHERWGAQCQLPAMDWWLHLMCIFAEAQRHSIPFKEELNGLLSTLSDTGDTIERWFKVR